jgi:hypothetical protein
LWPKPSADVSGGGRKALEQKDTWHGYHRINVAMMLGRKLAMVTLGSYID